MLLHSLFGFSAVVRGKGFELWLCPAVGKHMPLQGCSSAFEKGQQISLPDIFSRVCLAMTPQPKAADWVPGPSQDLFCLLPGAQCYW